MLESYRKAERKRRLTIEREGKKKADDGKRKKMVEIEELTTETC